MAYAHNGAVRIYWETQGKGEPLLLIMGLGCGSNLWYRMLPLLTPYFQVITFDNRGIGKSDCPEGPYTATQMAEDALAVMQAAGVESTHVMGVSLGGVIAQELTLIAPDTVRSLILGCSHPGFSVGIPPIPEVIAIFRNRSVPAQESFWAMRPYGYAQDTPDSHIEEDISVRLQATATAQGFNAQAHAGGQWVGGERLSAIDCPVLIIQGTEDGVVHPDNAAHLKKWIKEAQIAFIEKASHMFFTEKADEAAGLMKDFIRMQGETVRPAAVAECGQ